MATKQENLNQETPKTETVSKEEYDNLLKQALALEARYKKLLLLYQNLMDQYLSSNN